MSKAEMEENLHNIGVIAKNSYISCIICGKIIMYSKIAHQKTICCNCYSELEDKIFGWVDWNMVYDTKIQLVWQDIERELEFREEYEQGDKWSDIRKGIINKAMFSFFLEEKEEGERALLLKYLKQADEQIYNEVMDLKNEISVLLYEGRACENCKNFEGCWILQDFEKAIEKTKKLGLRMISTKEEQANRCPFYNRKIGTPSDYMPTWRYWTY